MKLTIVPGRFAVVRLGPRDPIPAGLTEGAFVSITRTGDELSIVCEEGAAPAGTRVERGWACLRLEGPIPFTATGILSALLAPLAAVQVGIFAISTFDTDYVLLKHAQLDAAVAALEREGHTVTR
jgi:hypothetical protein